MKTSDVVRVSAFMYKGIECVFSKKAEAIIPSDGDKIFLLDSFFAYETINSIKWVELKEEKNEDLLPMYSISNGIDELLFCPSLIDGDLLLFITSAEDKG